LRADINLNARPGRGSEAAAFDFEGVEPDRQFRHDIQTFFIRRRMPLGPCSFVGQAHGGVSYDRTRLIGDRAGDPAADGLSRRDGHRPNAADQRQTAVLQSINHSLPSAPWPPLLIDQNNLFFYHYSSRLAE